MKKSLFKTSESARASDCCPADAVLRKHGRTFHFANRFLAAHQRDRVARLYAFCRYTDDLADCSTDTAVARTALESLRHSIAHRDARCKQSDRLLSLADEVALPRRAALALIDGALSDLSTPRFQTERDLIRYSYQVAGTVGLMMCPMLDVDDSRAIPRAIDLGIGMQLTNIARDVAEDARAGRIYIPIDWTGIDRPEDMISPSPIQADALASGIKRLLRLADRYYQSGMDGLHFLPFRARLGVRAAALMYQDIGHLIAKHDYESWKGRAVVSGKRKLWLSIQGISTELLPTRPQQANYDRRLHKHLDKRLTVEISARQP